MTITFTDAQLTGWAGCTQKDHEPITQEMRNERVALFAEAKKHAPALAAELKRMRDENERMLHGLNNIRAFAAKRQHEGGPDGNLEMIEAIARAAITTKETEG